MLLGSSSEAADAPADLRVVTGAGDGAVEHGTTLLAFADAAHELDDNDRLASARAALATVVGNEGVVDAAATAAIFRSLNVAADATGIPFDGRWADDARSFAVDLGFTSFPTAANSPGW